MRESESMKMYEKRKKNRRICERRSDTKKLNEGNGLNDEFTKKNVIKTIQCNFICITKEGNK